MMSGMVSGMGFCEGVFVPLFPIGMNTPICISGVLEADMMKHERGFLR